MKKIGIVGGLSPESTVEYYKILAREYNSRKGGVSSPEIAIDSLDLQPLSELMADNKWDAVFETILTSVRRLENMGSGVIIIATNTIHKIFDKVEAAVETPMISIMEATAEAAKEKKVEKVGLLGTRFTMQSDFYPKTFKQYGIDVITPSEKDQKFIDDVVWQELTHHIIKEESKNGYLEIIDRLKAAGAQGAILGCTEIPLLIKRQDCDIPLFDTTKLHALAALEYSLKPEE